MLPKSKNPPSVWPDFPDLNHVENDWYIAHLRPRQEKALSWDLMKSEICYCCPFYTKTVRRKDNNKLRKTVLPVFPGYLSFAGTENQRNAVFKTGRVLNILPVVHKRRFLEEISWVLAACESKNPFVLVKQQEIKKGQTVKISSGPMKGYTGKVISISGRQCIVLSVDLFRQSVAMHINPQEITVL